MIPLPQKPKITKKEANRITVEIQDLYPGYGITIGNSLRRILLSSLEGAAITQVKIKNVPHEFSTLPGVAEDIILILLNLKKLRFKMFGNESQTAILKVSGEKEIKASDFKLPSQVEIINQDASIATLTGKKSSLEMEIRIERGVGYEIVDQRKEEKTEIGVMAVDSVYSPIVKVAYKVEDMRVGERTDFDRLVIEIETDGTMDPEEAFFKACEILHQHLALFLEKEKEINKKKEEKEEKEKKEEKESEEAEIDSLKIKIEDLKLSERVINVLIENKIKTVAGLVKKNEDDVLAFKGMGEKGVQEIKKALKKLDLGLKEQN
jgi:DNA-directed RNA polymerase subunit alpha